MPAFVDGWTAGAISGKPSGHLVHADNIRTARRMVLVVALSNALCLAYFHVVDRVVFSTAGFAPIFKFLLLHYDIRSAWVALGVCAAAATWRRPGPVLALVDHLGRHPFVVVLAAAIAFSSGALLVYHNYTFSMDEYAAAFQSKLFAAGDLYARLPPSAVDWLVVRGFNGFFLYASRESGLTIEAYWPGFAMLLAPFQFLAIPWACNAVLAAAAVHLIFRITLEITGDRRAAGWAMLFTVSSGAFVAYAISYYSMQAHLTLNLLFASLLLRPTQARAFAAGLVGSLALNLHNPFPHALFAAPWLVAMAMDARQRACLGPLVLGYLPGLCLLVAWLELRGTLVPAPAAMLAHAVPGGVFVWPDVALLNLRMASLVKLWLWASPCVLVLAWWGARRGVGDPRVRLLALSAGLTFIGYCFVRFDQGHGWGYRYFHSAAGCIPILAGVALAQDKSSAAPRLIAFVGATAILSLLVIVPLQLQQIDAIISGHLAQLPAPARPGRNVFFIKPLAGFYLADMVQNDPLLRGSDLFLATRGAALDGQLIRQNWPDAREIASGRWGDQWHIAPSLQSDSPGPDAPFSRLHFDARQSQAGHAAPSQAAR